MEQTPYILLIFLVLLDIALGVIGAVKDDRFSSKTLRRGLFNKAGYMGVCVLAKLLALMSGYVDLGLPVNIEQLVVGLVCLMETASILENCVLLNPELADNRILSVFKHKLESKNGTGLPPEDTH